MAAPRNGVYGFVGDARCRRPPFASANQSDNCHQTDESTHMWQTAAATRTCCPQRTKDLNDCTLLAHLILSAVYWISAGQAATLQYNFCTRVVCCKTSGSVLSLAVKACESGLFHHEKQLYPCGCRHVGAHWSALSHLACGAACSRSPS